MEKFESLIDKIKNYKAHNMFSVKSTTKTKKVYRYDESQNVKTSLVLSKKLQNLNIYKNYDLEPYDVEFYNKDCIEYLDIDNISWSEIENAISNLEIINNNNINPKEINSNCDLDIHQLLYEDGSKAFILNKHITIGSAFKNKIIFNGMKELDENKILSFSEYGDVVIYNKTCYILHEDKFNSIFSFRKKLDNDVANGKEEIESWQFLDHSHLFYEECNKNYNTKRAIVKALNKKGLEFLHKASPEQIRNKIQKHRELDDLAFDDNNKIIVTPESTKIILKILTNKIGLDLFTESIFGTEEKENDSEIS